MEKRSLAPLGGVLFVVIVLIAFIPIGGNTTDGDASARKVAQYFSDHENRQVLAAAVLALATVPLLFFATDLRQRLRAALPSGSVVPGVAYAAGALTAAGFLAAAAIHFALADYAKDIEPTAAQALNALDNDFFLPWSVGLTTMVLMCSVAAIRVRFLPAWLGWIGVLAFIASFTPAGFIAVMVDALLVIAFSVIIYVRQPAAEAAGPATPD